MDRFIRKEVIGTGTFGRVHSVLDRKSGKEYAMKVIDILQSEVQTCLKETELMKKHYPLNHPNIVPYIASFVNEKDSEYITVMEYCHCNTQII